MEIQKGIEIIGNSLYLKKHKAIVLSDLHLGFEESLNRQGVFVPRFQFKDIFDNLEKILKTTEKKGGVRTVILNGDLKHEFGVITNQEWRELRSLFRTLQETGRKVAIIRGNHDVILSPIAWFENVKITGHIEFEDILIVHGDKLPKKIGKKISTIIIGHEHPAVSLQENGRVERFKCFIKGKWKGKNLIITPSFNPMIEGTDLLKERTLSPFLKQDLSNFEIWIPGEEIHYFGRLKNLR
ncbi:MAG: metallophosphoesterase [Nanoarchaeota archaeon]|nr:MAG: metallophosphoesterase [Nanoarchaeota archaeon]